MRLEETASAGEVPLDSPPPRLQRQAPCAVRPVPLRRPRIVWVDCHDAAARAYVEHSDGLLLFVESIGDSSQVRALIESLQPRLPTATCGAACGLGDDEWLGLRAEDGRRLARLVDARGFDIVSTVAEVAPLGAPRLRIEHVLRHAPRPADEGSPSRKITLLGTPLLAYPTSSGHLRVTFTTLGDSQQALYVFGSGSTELERAVRMVEVATPGPGFEGDVCPAFATAPKRDLAPRWSHPWMLPGSLTVVLLALVAAWRLGSRARRGTS